MTKLDGSLKAAYDDIAALWKEKVREATTLRQCLWRIQGWLENPPSAFTADGLERQFAETRADIERTLRDA